MCSSPSGWLGEAIYVILVNYVIATIMFSEQMNSSLFHSYQLRRTVMKINQTKCMKTGALNWGSLEVHK